MNSTLTQAAEDFRQANAKLIAASKRGEVTAIDEVKRRISAEINKAIGLFDDFDAVHKEFEAIVRQKG